MFETLLHIPWETKRVLPGTKADRIPEALCGLLSENPDIRKQAYWHLDNCVVVQSDLYEAAWYVIPFLLEILQASVDAGREEVYDLLYEIGNGGARPEQVIVHENGTTYPLEAACREEVIAGWPLYLADMHHERLSVKGKALELIESLPEVYGHVVKDLEAHMHSEVNDDFRVQIGDALRTMKETGR